MKLSELLKTAAIDGTEAPMAAPFAMGRNDAAEARRLFLQQNVSGVYYRSQDVVPGGIFVAIKGFAADGHDYIPQAVIQGAIAVVCQQPVKTTVPTFQVSDSRIALADLAVAYHGNPSKEMVLIGITGTNGKTTITYLIESILEAAGAQVGVIGTINYRYAGHSFDNPVTTPESLDLQSIMARMRESGTTHVVMEISSHALELHRVRGCQINVGVFTNLSQDHLDFHHDMAGYWESKKKLFTEIMPASMASKLPTAVINCNDARGKELAPNLTLPVITTGSNASENVWAQDVIFGRSGISARIHTPQGEMAIRSPLTGRHNLENILNAVGVGRALNVSLPTIRQGIENLQCIPGRLERVKAPEHRYVYVDYAHTPDALENVLTALRELTERRLICIFGCGGDRDKGKRPQMGAIAARLSDVAIVTSDNPRTEEPAAIIDDILSGMTSATPLTKEDYLGGTAVSGYMVEPDRRSAILLGIQGAAVSDTIIIAGKGHETYQIIGRQKNHFDDREIAAQALAEQDTGV